MESDHDLAIIGQEPCGPRVLPIPHPIPLVRLQFTLPDTILNQVSLPIPGRKVKLQSSLQQTPGYAERRHVESDSIFLTV